MKVSRQQQHQQDSLAMLPPLLPGTATASATLQQALLLLRAQPCRRWRQCWGQFDGAVWRAETGTGLQATG
jgi:hypothetical protein